MEGRQAVVVGAGQPESDLLGNGRAIATFLAREGAEVCCVDRDMARAEATAEIIRQAGGTAHVITADVGNADDCVRLIEESAAAMGGIDTLVNNVAINHVDADPLSLDIDGWQLMMDINLRSQWLTSRTVVPFMRKSGGGAITNISTIGSKTLGGRMFAYAISKAGVNALTHFFAGTFAGDNIRCNTVLPAWVLTPHSIEGLTRHGWVPSREELERTGSNNVPMHRMGSAEDVANAVLFLSSNESNFITGLEVPVDGGALQMIGRYTRPQPVAETAA
ncbi:NAD(P)-dependent dehydrogenase, short-chain alcohol dehydrogenase family [Novosphingobium sp. CF614]|nr:NAD(P)-dependent dehydrogenase, short-chain alcohol dehydrogenase family [Novosphingobium sp. CF614]